MINLNETQKKAVDIKDTNTLVFASAGAGKTTVLVERLMKRILIDAVPIKRIVAMTFTEAAAKNMKNRLRTALNNALSNVNDQKERNYLEDQIANLSSANVSTIHSFCLNILKEYYYKVDLSPATINNLIDDALSANIKDQLLNEVINETIDKDKEAFIELASAISPELFAFDNLKGYILGFMNKALTKPDPIYWLNSLRQFKEINSFDDFDDEIKFLIIDDIHESIKEIIEGYYDIVVYLESIDKDASAHKAIIQALESLLEVDNYSYLANNLETLLMPFATLRGDKIFNDFRSDLLNKKIKPLIEGLESERSLVETEELQKPLYNLLIEMTISFYNKFQNYKKENEYIDFNDLEHYAYKILTLNNNEIANKYKNSFDEIMIDEFQDTNEIQYTIASLIANNNLFLVGDIKQSIYRFRAAKPKIMQSLKDNPDFEVIHIKENYRSKENLVSFNNKFFNILMNSDGNSFDESDKQIAPLESQKDNNEAIIFKLFEGDKKNFELKNIKANLLVEEIINLNLKGTAFKDMAVLVRNHKDKIPIKRAFETYNIPYYMEDTEGYFNSYAIDVLLSYIKIIIDPGDRISLTSVLLSRLYSYSEDDVANISLKKDILKFQDFQEDYKALKNYALSNNYEAFFTYFLKINDFYMKGLSTKEKANLDLLLSKLESYKIHSLNSLVLYIEATIDKQKDNAFDLSEDANVVKVMTIHYSKGLEFDTVFLWGQSEKRDSETSRNIIFDEDLGAGFRFSINKYRLSKTSIRRKAIAIKNKREDLAEYDRLLYVALTRSKRRLIIIEAVKDAEKTEEKDAFSNYLYRYMEDGELMHIQKTSTLPLIEPLKVTQKTKEIKQLYYKDIATKEVYSPSSLESSKLSLNLDNIGQDFGTNIHKLMELIDFNNFSKEALLAIDPEVNDNILNYLLKFKDKPIFSDLLSGEIHKEYPFFYKDEEKEIEGIMDLVSIHNDYIILVDYKTDVLDDENLFIERYSNQINTYKDILKEAFNKEINSYIYSFHLNKFISL